MTKIYIHHFFNKSLFYILCHNTTDRKYVIENDVGSVFCKYKNLDIEFIFKKEMTFENDGYHILDYFTAYFDGHNDPKIGFIERDREFMERENQQIFETFINLLKECPKNQNWIITFFRTEKILHSIDTDSKLLNNKIIEIESLLKKLNEHFFITDNVFLNNRLEQQYPNFNFAFTNSIFQWNRNLNIRWYYEFKSIFERLNFEYDLMYTVRNYKNFRIKLINELNKLKNDKIYLQTSDTLKGNRYHIINSSKLDKDIPCNSIYGNSDFEDISYLQNIVNGLDLFFRVLPKAKMQILCESWSEIKKDFNTQYLSEKTIGFILSGIPFISTHEYPLLILEKIFNIPRHPFFDESKKFKSNPELFANFVGEFMNNFDTNYELCKKWSDLVFEKFMYKIENENSLLDLIINNSLQKGTTKKSII